MELLLIVLFSSLANASDAPMTPFPVFLKMGYSSILDFEEAPQKVVLGDSKSFQIEKLNNSVVLRPLVDETMSNMFVYFKNQRPRLFILTVSEEVNPTVYKKFSPVMPKAKIKKPLTQRKVQSRQSIQVTKVTFDKKKDFLTIELKISSSSRSSLAPDWDKTRLVYKKQLIKPNKLWAERQTVQKDSQVSSRFIFQRPDIPRDLKATELVIPLKNQKNPLRVILRKGA